MNKRIKLVCNLACCGVLLALGTGCTTAIKIGAKVVGDTVNEVDVDAKSKKLVGQPVQAADTEFGPRIAAFAETGGNRELMTYPVEADVLSQFRWVVEAENGKIVAVAKAKNNPDGAKSIIKKALLEEKVMGKSPAEIGANDHFKKLILTLRNLSTNNLVRVYDVHGLVDLLGARYCVLEFDVTDKCIGIRLVGVPAASDDSSVGGKEVQAGT
jgi:uncharacterized protein YegP (UPF0339 family)